MDTAEIIRLANQMIAVEKDPDNTPLCQKHSAEWRRLPWDERAAVVKEVTRIQTSGR